MPIYEYRCNKCNLKFEDLVENMTQKLPKCPKCGSEKTEKLFSTFSSSTKSSAPAPSCPSGGCCPGCKLQ